MAANKKAPFASLCAKCSAARSTRQQQCGAVSQAAVCGKIGNKSEAKRVLAQLNDPEAAYHIKLPVMDPTQTSALLRRVRHACNSTIQMSHLVCVCVLAHARALCSLCVRQCIRVRARQALLPEGQSQAARPQADDALADRRRMRSERRPQPHARLLHHVVRSDPPLVSAPPPSPSLRTQSQADAHQSSAAGRAPRWMLTCNLRRATVLIYARNRVVCYPWDCATPCVPRGGC